LGEARRFGKAIWDIVGERRNPAIVFEHPGEDTVPTSIFLCEEGGMVAICAGTTGYSAMVDLRYLWTRQKRFQGSHGSSDEQAIAYNDLVREGRIDPCLARVIRFEELPLAHYEMGLGKMPPGNTVALVGAPKLGLGNKTHQTSLRSLGRHAKGSSIVAG
jgi:crotonyl-CoA carboxylase/reductase